MATYEYLKYNGNKIQVDSAVRDGNGKNIAENYASKSAGKAYAITEDMVTVTTDTTKGVAPYNTSYGYTNIEIDKESGIEWQEGAMYTFIVDSDLVVASAYRNVRVRIGGVDEGDSWHPVMGPSSAIAAGSTYFVKTYTTIFQYKSIYHSTGALHVITDNNTTYASQLETYTAGVLNIDANGYGARYSLAFPTTPVNTINEKYSSLCSSSSSAATKTALTSLTFYADRPPHYIYSANITAGAASANTTYEAYTGVDLRYTANTNATYLTTLKRVFLWLKDYDSEARTFKADATVGNIMSIDKISTRFPQSTQGEIYLYYLGTNTATWYSLTPNRLQFDNIYKYTPSTQTLELVTASGTSIPEDLTVKTLTAEKMITVGATDINQEGIVVGQREQPTTDQLEIYGSWTLPYPPGYFNANVSFYSNGRSFSSISGDWYGNLSYGNTLVCSEGAWVDEAYKEIDFGANPQPISMAALDIFNSYGTYNGCPLIAYFPLEEGNIVVDNPEDGASVSKINVGGVKYEGSNITLHSLPQPEANWGNESANEIYGTWQFVDEPDLSGSEYEWDVDFTVDGVQYHKLTVKSFQDEYESGYQMLYDTTIAVTAVYGTMFFWNKGKEINFGTSPQLCDVYLIKFLENASIFKNADVVVKLPDKAGTIALVEDGIELVDYLFEADRTPLPTVSYNAVATGTINKVAGAEKIEIQFSGPVSASYIMDLT